jgi:MFS family permease
MPEIKRPPTVLERIQTIYRDYPPPFWVLMTGTFIDRLGTNLIIPFLAIYVVQRFDAQITQIGLIYTIFAISSGIGNFLAGALADRFGRRLTLIMGLVCAATARLALGIADNFTGLYAAAAFAGFFGAIGWPAQLAMTADLLGSEKRANGFGIQRVVINSTFALGPLAGGFIGPQIGYLPLFILDALTSYFVAFIVFSKLPETRPEKGDGTPGENFAQTLAGYRWVLRDGTFLAFILISILTVTAYMQMSTTLSVYLIKFQHMPESFFGALVMLNALMVVFLQFAISRWASQRPLILIMISGTAFYLVGFGSYGLSPSIPLFIFAMIMITLGEMLVIPTSQALTALLAPPDMRARYVATERLNWIVAQSLGPLGAAAIMDHFDPRWVWYACSIVCAVSIVGFYGLHRHARQRLNEMQSVDATKNILQEKEHMHQDPLIVFVCEHGAAKSIVAAAYFNKMAREKGLNLRAIARGTHPDQTLSPQALTGLHEDGLTPAESVPQKLSVADAEAAQRVITFCELPVEFQEKDILERWDEVPPVSENYAKARDAIIEQIGHLINK